MSNKLEAKQNTKSDGFVSLIPWKKIQQKPTHLVVVFYFIYILGENYICTFYSYLLKVVIDFFFLSCVGNWRDKYRKKLKIFLQHTLWIHVKWGHKSVLGNLPFSKDKHTKAATTRSSHGQSLIRNLIMNVHNISKSQTNKKMWVDHETLERFTNCLNNSRTHEEELIPNYFESIPTKQNHEYNSIELCLYNTYSNAPKL